MCKKRLFIFAVFSLLGLILISCDNPSGGDPDPDPNPATYSLTVNESPGNSGTVTISPDKSEYDDGEKVTLEASSEDGWQFSDWSGARSSSQNPLEITMNSDMSITANFAEAAEAEKFSAEIDVTDGTQSRMLTFSLGDEKGSSEGLDESDDEGPPLAPPNAFFTGFKNGGMNLYKDYRPVPQNGDKVVWELRLERASNRDMELSWSVDSQLEGSLSLVDDPEASSPAVEVNMVSASNHTVSDANAKSIFIVYKSPNSSTNIGDFDKGDIIQEGINESDQGKIQSSGKDLKNDDSGVIRKIENRDSNHK